MRKKQIALDKAEQKEIIQKIAEKLRDCYVFPDIGQEIAVHLQKHWADGDYDGITGGKFFAYALTTHLQEINGDEHLWLKWHTDPLPDEKEALRLNEEWRKAQQEEARLNNYGFHKVERLPGNIGYMDIRFFHRPEWGGDTAVAVMNFVAHTEALIIDLRHCPGGYAGMVTLISSYLFGEQPVHLGSVYWRDEDITQQYWTLPFVPGQRFGDKPVYVLISRETFSGGESFAYDLQAQKRAIIVGEKTDGGAHPGTSYRLHPHIELFIPIGRAINPITNQNWEKSGVVPDVAVPQEQAFTAAYKLALTAVAENSDTTQTRLLKEVQTALDEIGTG